MGLNKEWWKEPYPKRQTKAGTRALTNDTVLAMRLAFWHYKTWTIDALSRKFGLSPSAVRRALGGYTYKGAGGPTSPPVKEAS